MQRAIAQPLLWSPTIKRQFLLCSRTLKTYQLLLILKRYLKTLLTRVYTYIASTCFDFR